MTEVERAIEVIGNVWIDCIGSGYPLKCSPDCREELLVVITELKNRHKAICKLAQWKGMDLVDVEKEWGVTL